MAIEHSTQETAARELHFTAATELYQLNPQASNTELCDQLTARLGQLTAMLTIIHGAGFEAFSGWNGEIQDNYLWGCSMLAAECYELAENVDFTQYAKRQGGSE